MDVQLQNPMETPLRRKDLWQRLLKSLYSVVLYWVAHRFLVICLTVSVVHPSSPHCPFSHLCFPSFIHLLLLLCLRLDR